MRKREPLNRQKEIESMEMRRSFLKTKQLEFLPHSYEAEEGILGVLMQDHSNVAKLTHLKKEHFLLPINQRIYEALVELYKRDQSINDPKALIEYVYSGSYEAFKINRKALLIHLGNCFRVGCVVVNPIGLADVIIEYYHRRELMMLGNKIAEDAQENRESIDKQVEDIENRLYKIVEEGKLKQDFVTLDRLYDEALVNVALGYKNRTSVTGVTTGLNELDRITGGFQKGDLTIIAGRPSMGKTSLAINMALKACKSTELLDGKVLFFSLEMGASQIATRIISILTHVNPFSIRTGQITQHDYDDINAAQAQYMNNLLINDTSGLSITDIHNKIKKMAHKINIQALFVDYLQLVRGTSKNTSGNRVTEITEVSIGLKKIAKEFDIPVIALSQLSRSVESREDKKPLLSDLRESGSIEQDADIVMFVYREEYYLRRQEPRYGTADHIDWEHDIETIQNDADIIVAKHRNGPIATLRVGYNPKTTEFYNVDVNQSAIRRERKFKANNNGRKTANFHTTFNKKSLPYQE